MSTKKKNHHYVPRSYLSRFCDKDGMVTVYRKDAPKEPYRASPSNTGFEGHYYTQEKPDGSIDTNSLEDFFSTLEEKWPALVDHLLSRQDVNTEVFSALVSSIALQRARVPAVRDAYELIEADISMSIVKRLNDSGALPTPPVELQGGIDDLILSIDPQSSLEAIPIAMNATAEVLDLLGLSALFNATTTPFITSDNPVIWYDPSVTDTAMRPYHIEPNGPVEMLFPITPSLMIYGSSSDLRRFRGEGFGYGSIRHKAWVKRANKLCSRFAYNTVFASDTSQCAIIEKHANESPTQLFRKLSAGSGADYLFTEMVFATKRTKAPWKKRSR